jgi:hypothetical protein
MDKLLLIYCRGAKSGGQQTLPDKALWDYHFWGGGKDSRARCLKNDVGAMRERRFSYWRISYKRKRPNTKRRPLQRSPFQSLRTNSLRIRVYRFLEQPGGSLQIRRRPWSVLEVVKLAALVPTRKHFAAPKSRNTLFAPIAYDSRLVSAILPAGSCY